jgi:hypothetical protein
MTKKVKHYRSAYQFFCIAIIDVIRKYSEGQKRKRGEIFSEMSELWREFKRKNEDPQVMKRINEEVEFDKMRYNKELYEWEWTNESREKLLKKFAEDESQRNIKFLKEIDALFEYENKLKQKTLDYWIFR